MNHQANPPCDMPEPFAPSAYRWDDLHLFLTLLRSTSLKQAARRLQLNASTVGRRLERFEEVVGHPLFLRTAEGIVATEVAHRLWRLAEPIEMAHAAFDQTLQSLEVQVAGEVAVTGPPAVLDLLIAPALPQLQQLHPQLHVELIGTNDYVDLGRGEADIALRVKRPEEPELTAWKIGRFESAVVGSAARYASQPCQSLDDLEFIQTGSKLRQTPDASWIERNAKKVVLRTSSIGAQLEAARRGVGVALVAAPFVHMYPELCEIQLCAPAPEPLPANEVFLVCPTQLRQVPRIDATWRFLRELTTSFPRTATQRAEASADEANDD